MDSQNSQSITSEKQQNQTIKVNKKAEKNIKNIITLPYEKFWPEIDGTQCSGLVELLQERLQPLKKDNETVPISDIRGKSDAEKKKLKLSLKQKKQSSPQFKEAKKLRSHILLGVNCVCRGLETSKACCVLVGGDVDPRLTVQHLVQLAALRHIPVLVLSNLKSIFARSLGFSCTALALKSSVSSDKNNEFHGIYLEIIKLAAQFPVPPSLTLPIIEPPLTKDDMDTSPSSPISLASSVQTKTPSSEEIIKKYHLKRPLSGGRAFIPAGESDKPTQDFIAFGNSDAMEVGVSEVKPLRESKKKPSNFQPLTVKRVKPNPDKIRKKKKKKKSKDIVK